MRSGMRASPISLYLLLKKDVLKALGIALNWVFRLVHFHVCCNLFDSTHFASSIHLIHAKIEFTNLGNLFRI